MSLRVHCTRDIVVLRTSGTGARVRHESEDLDANRLTRSFWRRPSTARGRCQRWCVPPGRADTVLSPKRVRRLLRLLGLHAVFQRPRTSTVVTRDTGSDPYLLRDLAITRPNHVWCTDVTGTSHGSGAFCTWSRYHGLGEPQGAGLSAILQHATRRRCLRRGLARGATRKGLMVLPRSSIATRGVNSPAVDFTDVPSKEAGRCRISMDGKGRWMDNVCHRAPTRRSLKYECVYLSEFDHWLLEARDVRHRRVRLDVSTGTGAEPHSVAQTVGRLEAGVLLAPTLTGSAWGSAPPPASQTQLES